MMTFVRVGDQVDGPFTAGGVKIHVASGRFTADTPARHRPTEDWSTLGKLFPELFPATGEADQREPEGPPAGGSADAPASGGVDELIANMTRINRMLSRFEPPPPQPGALEHAREIAAPLLEQMENRWGRTARPTTGFYAHRALTNLIQRLRMDALDGRTINERGNEYLARAAAYLATIVTANWERRGLEVRGSVQVVSGLTNNHIYFSAHRVRDGQGETYAHDFLADTMDVLLRPQQMLPYWHDRLYAMESLTLPSPEYLYLFGVAFMSSPHSSGNWPRGETVGCLEADFNQSRNLLVDDLHDDAGLPRDHEGYRKLSWWLVFPPYGWDMNDGNDYNMMTLFSQVSDGVVSRDEVVQYLRALLTCQGMEIRNLAARCLMVYRVPPSDSLEAAHYRQALEFRDHPIAEASMAKYQHQMEDVALTDEWRHSLEEERRGWLEETKPFFHLRTAAESDPLYQEMEQNPPATLEEGVAKLETLMGRFPEDWVLKVLHASQLLQGIDPPRGEQIMRVLVQEPPDCFEGHSRYGTWLKYAEGRRDEAFAVYEDALRRWPWAQQASDACVWMLTDGMTDA